MQNRTPEVYFAKKICNINQNKYQKCQNIIFPTFLPVIFLSFCHSSFLFGLCTSPLDPFSAVPIPPPRKLSPRETVTVSSPPRQAAARSRPGRRENTTFWAVRWRTADILLWARGAHPVDSSGPGTRLLSHETCHTPGGWVL